VGKQLEPLAPRLSEIASPIRERIRPRSAVGYIAVIAHHEANRPRRLSDGWSRSINPYPSGQGGQTRRLPG
jgi:hypothetical protein